MQDKESAKKITLKAELNRCDEFPSKKHDFLQLCNELKKKGYSVEQKLEETMGSAEKYEISLVKEGKDFKIFTNSDPYAKEAIIDSSLSERITDVINKIEKMTKQ